MKFMSTIISLCELKFLLNMSEREDVKVGRIIIIKITHSKTFFLAVLFSYTPFLFFSSPNGQNVKSNEKIKSKKFLGLNENF